MIYGAPRPEEPIDQGDLVSDCPILAIQSYDPDHPADMRAGALRLACWSLRKPVI